MKQLVLIAIAGLFLVSCSKEKSFETSTGSPGGGNTTYYITAKINGTLTTFNVNDVAKITDFGSGLKSLSITGSASSDPSSLKGIDLSINFFNIAPAVGTYAADSSSTDYMTAGIYNPDSSMVVYTTGVSANSALPLTITLTKLDNTVVEGTFKGAFYKTDISSGTSSADYLTMSEGSFRLPIQ